MNAKPDSSLKAVQVAICYDRNEKPYPVIVFNDGSAWRKYRENWHCVWDAPKTRETFREDESSVFDELLEKVREAQPGQRIQVMPGPVQLVERNADDVKPFAQLKAERDAWKKETGSARKALDFQFKQRAHLQARLSELEAKLAATEGELRNQEKWADGWCKRATIAESQLKAWQDAASVKLVEDSDEIQIPCETPEQLIERLRNLYRWASTSDTAASEARVQLGVCEMKLEKTSAEVAQLSGKLKTWEKVDRTRGESASESIHWPRVYATAIEVAQYQQDKLGKCKESYICEAAVGLIRALIKLGSCDPVRCHPVKWH